jgi:hypothetical protein
VKTELTLENENSHSLTFNLHLILQRPLAKALLDQGKSCRPPAKATDTKVDAKEGKVATLKVSATCKQRKVRWQCLRYLQHASSGFPKLWHLRVNMIEVLSSRPPAPIYQAPAPILPAPNPGSFHQALHAAPHPGLHRITANGENDDHQSVELQESNFMDFQWLVISVNVLHSTVSFILDTLIIHRDLVGQLQDEVASLRIQVEVMQSYFDQRNSAQVLSATPMVNKCHSSRETPAIPGLNLSVAQKDEDEDEEVEVLN